MKGPVIALLVLSATVGYQTTKPTETMRVERTRGLSGVSEIVSVHSDGRVVSQSGKTQQIDPATAAAFVQSIPRVAAPLMSRAALPQNRCADCFIYIFTVPETDRERAFFLEETLITSPSGNESQEMKGVFAFLHRLFGGSKSR